MRIKNFNYNKTEVTAILHSSNYLWIAFKGSGGNCTLYKTSAFQPDQVFYEITVPVDKITAMKADNTYLYLSVEDDTYSAVRYSLSNPLGAYVYLARPSGVDEQKTVDIGIISSTEIFILVPGEASGENAKVIKVNGSFVFIEVIDLKKSGEEIIYARTMDADDNNNLWIGTYTNPSLLVRVHKPGASYEFTSWEII